jgi:hypothetical protein
MMAFFIPGPAIVKIFHEHRPMCRRFDVSLRGIWMWFSPVPMVKDSLTGFAALNGNVGFESG